MKKVRILITALFAFLLMVSASGCTKKEELFGVWKYTNEETGNGAVYELRDDGTGSYTIISGGTETAYEIHYNVERNHLLFVFTNHEEFTEDDLFDTEFKLKDADTLLIKDSAGNKLPFIRQK